MTTLFEHAWILTMDDAFAEHRDGWLLVSGDTIAALGSGAYTGDAPIDERIDCRGGILLPGFVNTHCHASMVPFRTMGDDCPDRLRRFLFPLENEAMTPELVYLGAKYGIAEMLLAGVTTFLDMYYFEDEVARACRETGMRGYLGETIIGQTTCDSPDTPYGGFDIAEAMFARYRGCDLVRPIVAPHGTTTLDADALRRCYEMALRHDALMTLHVSEMDYEMRHFAEQGTTPMAYLDALGAAEALGREGVSVEVADMFSLKPLDSALVLREAAGKRLIVTVENHSVTGGLGSAVAELLAEQGAHAPLLRVGVREQFGQVGSLKYLKHAYGLDAESITDAVRAALKN